MTKRVVTTGESTPEKAGSRVCAWTAHDSAFTHSPLTAIDLFAGAGGFSLGLRRAGFDIVLANEYSVDAEWTYRHNILGNTLEGVFPARPDDPSSSARATHRAKVRMQMLTERQLLSEDIDRCMRGGDIREALSDRWLNRWIAQCPNDVDLLVAGPPCQGFSLAGRAPPDDERNLLVYEVLRVIDIVQPRIAIIENVPGMLWRHTDLVCEIGVRLSLSGKGSPGYHVCAELVHGEPLGVPQTRRRLLFVAVRRDLIHSSAYERLPSLLLPVSCPRSRPHNGRLFGTAVPVGSSHTTEELLGDLVGTPPPYGSGKCWTQPYRSNGKHYTNQFLCEMRTHQMMYMNGGVANFPSDSALEGYYNHEASKHRPDITHKLQLLRKTVASSPDARMQRCSSSWLRNQFGAQYPELLTKKVSQRVLLADEWPMLTVTSLPDDIVHYAEDRTPTVREVARLQTFPDWFEFKGVRTTGSTRRREGVYVPQYTQVANAVPPRFAHAVAARIRQFLQLVEDDPECHFEPDGGYYVTPNLKGKSRLRLDEINTIFRICSNMSDRQTTTA